ncbi:trp repressor/replication initiator [Desulfoluna butyratoxydans]|uniref:Trp repressor/replication initiator n=2 Tax=Desulfoluna butyratoxydans TaxID=231438 RepID=A0A4V6IKZ5_9BACT|nr:trp repressor/replication initiator [Desulfoluna butyratoxydans]
MKEAYDELLSVLAETTDLEKVRAFLDDILTPKERSDLAMRWQLMVELHQGQTQRSIAKRHNISLCKITRGSKILKTEDSFTANALKKRHPKE